MKQFSKLSRAVIAIALMLGVSLSTLAHDFEVDGIYYNYIDQTAKTVAVTYKGDYSYSYNEYTGSVTIPSSVTYSGITFSVTYIGSYAFYCCTGLTSVTIPNSVTSIGSYAFAGCSGLTLLTIPNSVTSIGQDAFSGCSGLTSVTIGDSVTSIGDGAFSDCTGLTSLTIPKSVTSIGQYAFYDCDGLTSIVVSAENSVYDSRDNCNAIIESSTNTLIVVCKNTTIPKSVTSIGKDAFYDCDWLTSVTIPNSVTSIGDWAFAGCSDLTSLTIPNSVTSIGSHTFSHCTGLTSVTIGNSVTSIEDHAFNSCSSLTSVTIPNSVTSIGDWSFASCDGLTSVTIPNSVTSIGQYAFSSCSGLTSVTIGNSVTSIGDYAFNCRNLKLIISLNPVPQTYDIEDSFYSGIYTKAILYVPKDSYAKYFMDEIWGKFTNIVKIESIASSIKLNSTSVELDKGADYTLSATIDPANATITDVAWKSSNPSVAIVDQTGKVTALSAGTTEITATTIDGSNVSVSCVVTVNNVETKITLSQTEATLPVNDIMTLSYDVVPSTTSVQWSTSNADVAGIKVNADNSVTVVGMADGIATITATATDGSGVSASCVVTVGNAGITDVKTDNTATEIARYDIHGRKLSQPSKGINIIRMSDGTIRKEFVK